MGRVPSLKLELCYCSLSLYLSIDTHGYLLHPRRLFTCPQEACCHCPTVAALSRFMREMRNTVKDNLCDHVRLWTHQARRGRSVAHNAACDRWHSGGAAGMAAGAGLW